MCRPIFGSILDPSSPAKLEQKRLEFEASKQQLRDTVLRLLDAERKKREAANDNRE
jgi:hypothetical protein